MNNPKLIKSSETHEVWECGGRRLYHEKKYSMGTGLGYICGTYRFNEDVYISCQNSWNTMYTIRGKSYTIDDYISLKTWCRAVGFIE